MTITLVTDERSHQEAALLLSGVSFYTPPLENLNPYYPQKVIRPLWCNIIQKGH